MTTSTTTKKIYFFGNNQADGKASIEMRNLIGGKGANLAEMTNMGIPVPAGFTISTEECTNYYNNGKQISNELLNDINDNLKKVESSMGQKFGDPDNPLLFSVRSGARVSMPGMMDTVLNLGLNDVVVEGLAKKSGKRFAWDSYRRFIQMFCNVVLGVEHNRFESILDDIKKEKNITNDTNLTTDDLKELVARYKSFLKDRNVTFPQEPAKQLEKAIEAVFGSWNADRAIKYRELNNIPGSWGTAVNVQAMVFGNMGLTSGTGVAFTRNPSTGENVFYGEYLMNAQGEDVVAGIRTPHPIQDLEKEMPEIYSELVEIYLKLEKHFHEMQDLEFTIQDKKLYILQTRNGKRTAPAAIKIAVDMVNEGLISKEDAILKISASQLDQLLHPMIDPKAELDVIAKGLPASPGAAVGKAVFTADDAEEWKKKGEKVILIREETSPEDIGGMAAAEGILTERGGMTSHAAVVARGMGKCCVAGCSALKINEHKKTLTIGDTVFQEGDDITLNGSTGEVIKGKADLIQAELSGDFEILMDWVDKIRNIKIRTNADTPLDSEVARKFGAEGIGLCRTEHMFFEGDRIQAVREMILANSLDGRKKALAKILPMQKSDFTGIFTAMEGLPVTIRLLDPPLHEFLPHDENAIKDIAKELNVSVSELKQKIESLKEFNPMLGHRGCRLGITYPEIYEMQAQAIIEAACELTKQGKNILPEIMIPLVGEVKELGLLKDKINIIAQNIIKEYDCQLNFVIGTMIEIPRAALLADEIAAQADFFSFGTNDLTQMTFGLSRDDSGSFLQEYVQKEILDNDPFQVLDQKGVGKLIKLGVEQGRKVKPDLKIGICGEHGGEPSSIDFCIKAGFNYVSCSPYRIPIARLAAAQTALTQNNNN
ncbi:MAG: pyruvate, phosphate dikinase [bacterium]|nr:pyruvate, phosphate dikinase [bacterium]